MMLKNKKAVLFWGNKKSSKSSVNNEVASQELRRQKIIEASEETLTRIKRFVQEAIVLIDSSENLEPEEEQKIKAELDKDIMKIRRYISTLKKLAYTLNNDFTGELEGKQSKDVNLTFLSKLNSLPDLFLGTHLSIRVYRQKLRDFKNSLDEIEI